MRTNKITFAIASFLFTSIALTGCISEDELMELELEAQLEAELDADLDVLDPEIDINELPPVPPSEAALDDERLDPELDEQIEDSTEEDDDEDQGPRGVLAEPIPCEPLNPLDVAAPELEDELPPPKPHIQAPLTDDSDECEDEDCEDELPPPKPHIQAPLTDDSDECEDEDCEAQD